LEGDHVFVLLYASCLSTFQAPGWGIPAAFLPCRRGNATPRELVPFSHRSASRIFISQPGCTPRRRSPKTVTTNPWVGRSKPGCDPAAFEGEGAHWPCGRVGLRQRGAGRLRASSAPACRARRLGPRCPLLPESGCRALCAGGPPKMSRATRAAFVFWGGPAFAPVWRLRAEVGAPLVREDLSGDQPEG
jgi:hypothetical protein